MVEMTMPSYPVIVTQDCRFPGSEIYYALQQLYGITLKEQRGPKNKVQGWLSDYQISHGFSSPGMLTVLLNDLSSVNGLFSQVSSPISRFLSEYYSSDTIEEWLEENIFERIRKNNDTIVRVKNLMNRTTWDRKPFDKVEVGKGLNTGSVAIQSDTQSRKYTTLTPAFAISEKQPNKSTFSNKDSKDNFNKKDESKVTSRYQSGTNTNRPSKMILPTRFNDRKGSNDNKYINKKLINNTIDSQNIVSPLQNVKRIANKKDSYRENEPTTRYQSGTVPVNKGNKTMLDKPKILKEELFQTDKQTVEQTDEQTDEQTVEETDKSKIAMQSSKTVKESDTSEITRHSQKKTVALGFDKNEDDKKELVYARNTYKSIRAEPSKLLTKRKFYHFHDNKMNAYEHKILENN